MICHALFLFFVFILCKGEEYGRLWTTKGKGDSLGSGVASAEIGPLSKSKFPTLIKHITPNEQRVAKEE